MKYLAHIVGILNSALAAGLPCDPAQRLGLCQLAKRKIEGSKEETAPYEFNAAGEAVDATPDDRFIFSSYHRSLSLSTTRVPGGYGDGDGNLKVQHKMSLVIWAKQLAVMLSQDEMAMAVHLVLPDRLKKVDLPANITDVKFNITDVVLNGEQVFNDEFKNVEYFIFPEHIFLKVNYTIESTMNKRCFNTLCGSNAA